MGLLDNGWMSKGGSYQVGVALVAAPVDETAACKQVGVGSAVGTYLTGEAQSKRPAAAEHWGIDVGRAQGEPGRYSLGDVRAADCIVVADDSAVAHTSPPFHREKLFLMHRVRCPED